jgi:amino acid transporter
MQQQIFENLASTDKRNFSIRAFMTTIITTRPRNINYLRAAGILYGDLGTSKAYVLGLAFALAGYASFWFILAVSILTIVVGLNYVLICKFYPQGGGVYTSVRERSHLLSIVGAFFLISDYLVTAALSALSAFHYLGVPQPELWAIGAIFSIGLLNFLGPKQTGGLAIALAIPTIICMFLLIMFSIPFLPKAVHSLAPISSHWYTNWNVFVGIIVALSGIEAIANTTSSMQLDPGFSNKKPSVFKTSTRAIILVIVEVSFFTAFLGLAMTALPGLEISEGTVNAPDYPDVRDAMLRYMGEIFAGTLFGPLAGKVFGIIISIVITLLLLSAVNTAIIALGSLLFVMARDGEMPSFFLKLNRFGVPLAAICSAFLIPMGILLFVTDIAGLANLYAIGFVGAIAVNLGATSTNSKLDLNFWQRLFMFATCLIMTGVEISLFIDKPDARMFVLVIMGVGLVLHALAARKKVLAPPEKIAPEKPMSPLPEAVQIQPQCHWLVAVNKPSKCLKYALNDSQLANCFLHVLFLREQEVVTDWDRHRTWMEDADARKVMDYIVQTKPKNAMEFIYAVTPNTAYSIGEIAAMKKVDRVIVDKRKPIKIFMHALRKTTIHDIAKQIPKDIELLVIY